MRRKQITIVILIVVILGTCLWWFWRPRSVTSKLKTEIPTLANTNVAPPFNGEIPQSNLGDSPVALPPAPLATTSPSANPPVSAPSLELNDDPRANLETAMAEANRLYGNDDIVAFWEKFTSPDMVREIQAQGGRTIEEYAQMMRAEIDRDPNKLRRIASVVDILNSTQGQSPALSSDGSTAVYNTVAEGQKWQITMKKQDNRWYFGDDHGGMIYLGPAN